jgi:hypothetical protein
VRCDWFLDIDRPDHGLQDLRRHDVLDRHLIPRDSVELLPVFGESDVAPDVARPSLAVDGNGAPNVDARLAPEDPRSITGGNRTGVGHGV